MFKKLIAILSSIAVGAVASSSVVSCTAASLADGTPGERIAVVTDGGHINDKAFNQDAYEGTSQFINKAFGAEHGTKNSYVEPADASFSNIVSGYRLAAYKGANALVLPGFTHANVVPQCEDFLKDINLILVDCEFNADNTISVTFNSQLSGFLAGINTSYWATEKTKDGKLQGDINNDGHITFGTFIGSHNKLSTDNYSWGLLLGMATYNAVVEKEHLGRPLVYSANTENDGASESDEEISKVSASDATDTDWYSGTFDSGGANKKGIPARLIDEKQADIMFPVAGAQANDVISYKHKTYLIGVDVDQAYSYESVAKGRYVTSAIKNIHQAVSDALYSAQSDTRKNTLDIKDNPLKGNKWLGTTPDPYMDWSINYTQENKPNSGYLMKKNVFNFIPPEDQEKDKYFTAKDVPLAEAINKKFKYGYGDNPAEYFNGKSIVEFAKELVNEYAIKFSTSGK